MKKTLIIISFLFIAGFIHEYPSPFPNPYPYPIPNPYPDPNPNPNPNNPWDYGGHIG